MFKPGTIGLIIVVAFACGTSASASVPPQDQQTLYAIQQAIVQYGRATGYYPPTLDDLYPHYLPRLPRTATGEHFFYNNQNGYVAHPGTTRPGSYGGLPALHHSQEPSGIHDIDTPGRDRLVLDHAGILSQEHYAALQGRARQLLDQQGVALITLIVRSPVNHGGARGEGELEQFARRVMGHWRAEGLHDETLPRDQTLLFIIATEESEAWIELGSSRGNVSNAERERFLNRYVRFHLNRRRPISATMTGTEALDRLLRGQRLPPRPRPAWHYNVLLGLAVVAALSVLSFATQGVGGYAWVFWGLMLSILGYLLIIFTYDYRIAIITGTSPGEHMRNLRGGMGRGFGAYSVRSSRGGW